MAYYILANNLSITFISCMKILLLSVCCSKKYVFFALMMAGTSFLFSSCAESGRRPVGPESVNSQKPWNKMESFEQNAIFGPMNRRR